MRSFEPGFIDKQPISQILLSTIRLLGEYKGKQELYARQTPETLERLTRVAVIESTESSNRIEGISAPPRRIKDLVAGKGHPHNRSEQEIAGYRDALALIHTDYRYMPVTPGLVQQLHRDIHRYLPGGGGRFKPVDNEIIQRGDEGAKTVLFKPVPAHQTAEHMAFLHDRFNSAWETPGTEPLLLIASYILDLLCIHPFLDGNGRTARLMSLLLLYKAGYEVGRYISLERIVEDTRSGYYDALQASSEGWHEGRHSLVPWWEYFLGVMLLTAYREFEGRVGTTTVTPGGKSQAVAATIQNLPAEFRYSDLADACPGVSRPTVTRVLQSLRSEGKIECIRSGRNATWRKT